MGWFDGIFGSRDGDPLGNLDPKVREFLQRESPVKYQKPQPPPPPSQPAPPPSTARQKLTTKSPSEFTQQPNNDTTATLPRESLYQDGRFAHLWRTYTPQASIDDATKTDHEKLMDVLEGYKARKARIGRVALENCALEQDAWVACMKSGDVGARFTMCRDAVRKFEKCYNTQSRLLRALGYLSDGDGAEGGGEGGLPGGLTAQERDERVQMHADMLYQRIVAQEAALEKAKKEGKEPPAMEPVVVPAMKQTDEKLEETLDAGRRKKWQEQLEKVPETERAAEEEAMRGDLRAQKETAAKFKVLEEERKRKTEGRTITHVVSSWLGR